MSELEDAAVPERDRPPTNHPVQFDLESLRAASRGKEEDGDGAFSRERRITCGVPRSTSGRTEPRGSVTAALARGSNPERAAVRFHVLARSLLHVQLHDCILETRRGCPSSPVTVTVRADAGPSSPSRGSALAALAALGSGDERERRHVTGPDGGEVATIERRRSRPPVPTRPAARHRRRRRSPAVRRSEAAGGTGRSPAGQRRRSRRLAASPRAEASRRARRAASRWYAS